MIHCPRCNVAMNSLHRQGVETDVCPQCRGVWLDRGELDKIVDRYDAYERDDEDAQMRRPDFRQRHRVRDDKPFWSEIFD